MADRKILFLNDYAVTEEAHPDNDQILVGAVKIATTGPILSSTGLDLNDTNISETNNITFTDVNGQIAGIENQNLLDKTATETISGAYTISGNVLTMSENLVFDDDTLVIDRASAADIQIGNLIDKTAAETISGAWTYNNNISFDTGARTIAGIQNQNLVDKTATETVSGEWTFSTTPQMTGTIDSDNDIVNKAYVDAIGAGFGPKRSVRLATTAELTGTYSNGSGGVGATLTNNGTQVALSLDNVATVVGDRVLVKDQKAEHIGTQDLSSGYDWGSTNQQFTIAKNSGSATTVTLNTLTTDVATTVTEINNELATAGIDADFEAFASGNYVGIRSKDEEDDNIVIAAGTPSALTTLGWTAGTYENFENGIYTVTNIGSGSTNWVLTRATDFDNSPDGEIEQGDFFPVEEGDTYAGRQFYQVAFSGAGSDAVGTNGITFTPFASPTDLIAGDGIDIAANVISVDVTDIIDTNSGLTETTNNIQVNLDNAGAIAFNSGALQVQVDDSTIEITGTSNGSLNVKANGITATEIDETDDYTWTGIHDFSGGDIVLPNNATGSPAEGNIYWDDTTNSLNVYDADGAEWKRIGESGTTPMTGGENIADGDFVYVSAANTIMKSIATSTDCVKTIGCADQAITSAATGDVRYAGVKTGLTLTAATIYYLSNATAGAITSTLPTGNGDFLIRCGISLNTTDLLVNVMYMGRRRIT